MDDEPLNMRDIEEGLFQALSKLDEETGGDECPQAAPRVLDRFMAFRDSIRELRMSMINVDEEINLSKDYDKRKNEADLA